MSRRRHRPLQHPCPHCGGRQPATFHASCHLRASWSPEERARFAADDLYDEALEHGIVLPPPDLDLEPAVVVPHRRAPVRVVAEAVLARRVA